MEKYTKLRLKVQISCLFRLSPVHRRTRYTLYPQTASEIGYFLHSKNTIISKLQIFLSSTSRNVTGFLIADLQLLINAINFKVGKNTH